jgi:hypothetical protein
MEEFLRSTDMEQAMDLVGGNSIKTDSIDP